MSVKDNWEFMDLPCGGKAGFDHGAGYGYRCLDCMAVVGSIGQPKHCQEEAEKYRNWEKLGGKGWEYFPNENKRNAVD
jgi:hypothetical protein